MKKFKITFIASSLKSGGAERVISELTNYFQLNSYSVHIILVAGDEVEYQMNDQIEIIPICKRLKHKSGILAVFERLYQIRKLINNISPDVTISFLSIINIYSCFALLGSKHKLIVSERNDPKADPKGKFKKIIRNAVYNLADGFVFQTQQAKDYFSRKIQKKAVVIPNPIKIGLPLPFYGTRNKNIVAVGRLEKQKNYPLLFEAFKDFSRTYEDYKLIVYGEGSERKHLEELIKSLNLENNVFLKGVVNNFHQEIVDSSMFIMTSDFEGMPNALMEAMAIGLPCISTDCPCGGPRFLIKHMENGLLFKVDDKDTLVKYMKQIVSDDNLSKKIAENAYIDSRKYSIDKIADKWLDFIETIL